MITSLVDHHLNYNYFYVVLINVFNVYKIKSPNKNRLVDSENKVLVAREEGCWGKDEIGERD